MFPVSLLFYLAATAESVPPRAVRGLFPALAWGGESDLLRHSDEWPASVVLVTDREGYEPEERCDFPVAVEFVHFPGRVAGNDLAMLATKLALLRRLSAAFECRVICDAKGFAESDGDSQGRAYAWVETFLCQGGRVYGGVVPHYDAREGIALPPPDSLDDEALTAKLWEVIHGLARVHTYLHRTDHLDDRELYTWLWEEGLNESTADLAGLDMIGGCHTSPIGGGDDESTEIELTYYDTAAERAEWKASYPDTAIPAHLALPCDRDRFLPEAGDEEFCPPPPPRRPATAGEGGPSPRLCPGAPSPGRVHSDDFALPLDSRTPSPL